MPQPPMYLAEAPVGADGRNPRYGSRAREEMGEFQQYFDIILFAMVAVFLVLRLRSVLGRRTGNERRRDLFVRRPRPAPSSGQGAGPRRPDERRRRHSVRCSCRSGRQFGRQGLDRIRRADPSFDPSQFLDGARVAFEMIVTAFAAGDKSALRAIVERRVFQQFATAIDERVAAKETLETRILRLDGATSPKPNSRAAPRRSR